MKNYCKHPDCVADMVQELLSMAEKLKRDDLYFEARRIKSHSLEVRCRHVPRDRVTPFAERRKEV